MKKTERMNKRSGLDDILPVQLRPVFMTLSSTPLHYSGQHNEERDLMLPDHIPELQAGVGQGALN